MKSRMISLTASILFLICWQFKGQVWAQSAFQDLDGVIIKAVEEYPSVKSSEMTLGFSALPFDPYYYGYGLSAGYNHYFNKKWGWQLIDFMFVSGTEKPLTTGLVDDGRDPDTIEKVRFLLTSNVKYTIAYGKSIFFDQFIRLTRTEVIAGLGGLITSDQTLMTVNLGLESDFVMSEDFSWKISFVNYFPPSKSDVAFMDYAAITLKSAWRFD